MNTNVALKSLPQPPTNERSLRRMKSIALSVLALAVVGFVVSLSQGGQGAWGWVKAFCEAAAVGALADWFAVVALFRHPLHLPIPHTALIPKSKDRIADNLAEFVRDKFLSPENLLQKLAVFNPAQRLGEWLVNPKNTRELTQSVRTIALEGLSFVGEESVKRSVNTYLSKQIQAWDASTTAANVIALMTKDGRHHQLLDVALERVKDYLDSSETRDLISKRMVSAVRREYPKIVSLVDTFSSVDKIGGSLAEKVSRNLVDEVHEALSQPQHIIRIRYEQHIHQFVDRLRSDEKFRQEVNQIKSNLSNSEAIRSYLDGLWEETRRAIENDLNREDSALMKHLESSLQSLGQKVSQDADLRLALNNHLMAASSKLVSQLQTSVTNHISSTVKSWNDKDFVEQIELSIGKDLQFIRLNGTLVGGLIGLVLHGATMTLR